MTREEAYSILHNGLVNAPSEHDWCMAFDMAIKALEQEPCDDTVSREVFKQVMWERDTAIEQLRKLGYGLGQKIEPCDDCVSRQEVEKSLRCGCAYDIWNLPSVLPKREHGEWIEVHPLQEDDGGAYMCSKCRCGHPCIDPDYWKYCPNCGAEMR